MATVLELQKCGGYGAVLDIQDIPEAAKQALGPNARYFKCDLTKEQDVEAAVKKAVEWCKETNAKLGGVVHCGGVAVAQKVSALEAERSMEITIFWQVVTGDGVPHSLDLFEFAMRINVNGTFDLTRRVLEHLVQADPEGEDGERGVIIMVSSSSAVRIQALGRTALSYSLLLETVRRTARTSSIRRIQRCNTFNDTSNGARLGSVWDPSQHYRTVFVRLPHDRENVRQGQGVSGTRFGIPETIWGNPRVR